MHDNAGGIGRALGTLAGKAVAAVQGTSETVKEQVSMLPVFSHSQAKLLLSARMWCWTYTLQKFLEICVAFFQTLL